MPIRELSFIYSGRNLLHCRTIDFFFFFFPTVWFLPSSIKILDTGHVRKYILVDVVL